MGVIVNIYEAKTQLSHLVERAAAGEEVVIARAGKPMVRMVPVTERARRKSGQLKGLSPMPDAFFDPLPEDELKLWE